MSETAPLPPREAARLRRTAQRVAAIPEIVIVSDVGAPIERCFDLARDIGTHLASTSKSGERVVGGVASGLLGLNDEVTWEARHFGIRFRLTGRITSFDRPTYFIDEQVRGPFASWWHRHQFEQISNRVRMTDLVRYQVPLGAVGRGVDWLVLHRYLKRLLQHRASFLKAAAEAPGSVGLTSDT